jgi:hypothetical protein
MMRRIGWLAGLWLAGVAALGVVVALLRLVMRFSGLSS